MKLQRAAASSILVFAFIFLLSLVAQPLGLQIF